jgi:dienelactone hydrolase
VQYAQLDTRATPLGKLVIFLPGANNVPRDWRDHGRQLAAFGFHVLIPHYNNRWSTSGVCDGQPNTCSNATRWEALAGEDTSPAIAIPRADSAEGRVVTMIKHLATEHPQGDWGYYLGADDAVLYDKMIIAGISHGAASTGMYATKRPFTRAVMHSSGPAGSTAEAKMTPLSEWYAFTHTQDPAYDAIAGAIDNWEIPGAETSIDGATPPYGESHRLITSAESEYPHGSTCAHSSSPKNGDVYVFEAAWRYLYGAPAQ